MLERFLQVFITAFEFHCIRWNFVYGTLLAAAFLVSIIFYLAFFIAPFHFPVGTDIRIPSGTPLEEVANILHEARVIKSPLMFSLMVRLSGKAHTIHAGVYRFDTAASVVEVVSRLLDGDMGIPPVRITFPEGFTARQMASLLEAALPLIDREEFLLAAERHEGYLFPDTYFFPISATTDDVVRILRDTFDKRIESLLPVIASSGHSISDVVTMASLLEREVNTPEDSRIVAGILWERLKIGMPLQVDAVFGYILKKDAHAPLFEDLKIESPYNTYLHQGLTPTPIGNPGLEAIMAAATPTKTKYLYYLTGKDGRMHYAATFAGHQSNREKYLK